jgi:hypothetical protein
MSLYDPYAILHERDFDFGTEALLKRPRLSGELASGRVEVRGALLPGPRLVVGHSLSPLLDRTDQDVRVCNQKPIVDVVHGDVRSPRPVGKILRSKADPGPRHEINLDAVERARSFDGIVDFLGDGGTLFVQTGVCAKIGFDDLADTCLKDPGPEKVVDRHRRDTCSVARGRSIFGKLPKDVTYIVFAKLPIDSRVALKVVPNRVTCPAAIAEHFASPRRINKNGQHVRDGVLFTRIGYTHMGVCFTGTKPTITLETFENHRGYVSSTTLSSPDFRFFQVEMMIDACDGEFGPDADFVADLKRRLQAWLKLRET